jgi:hypothetical protein
VAYPEYVLDSNRCVATCSSGTAVGTLCCPACGSGFNQFNATHCIKPGTSPAQYQRRATACVERAAVAPAQRTSRLVSNPASEKQCDAAAAQAGGTCYSW